MTDPTTLVPIEADREAAWPFRPACYKNDGPTLLAWRAGLYDNAAPAIYAMRDHRLQSIAALRAENETGWLVEEDYGGGVHWIALASDEWPRHTCKRVRHDLEIGEYLSPVERVKDAGKALRFARKEDAEAFIKLFGRFLLSPSATEHAWDDGHPNPQPQPQVEVGKRDG